MWCIENENRNRPPGDQERVLPDLWQLLNRRCINSLTSQSSWSVEYYYRDWCSAARISRVTIGYDCENAPCRPSLFSALISRSSQQLNIHQIEWMVKWPRATRTYINLWSGASEMSQSQERSIKYELNLYLENSWRRGEKSYWN